MKKIFVMMATLLIAGAAFAQESNRTANGEIQYGPYETNSFLSNWFVEVGGGVNVPVDGVSQIFKGDLVYDFGGLAVNANVGKWIDPCYGIRFGWQGLTTGNLDNKISFKDSFDGEHAFNYIHGDFMVNFSNLVAGYKAERLVDVVPYLTAGAAFADWNSRRALALGGGIQVPFNVSERVSIVPEVQALAMNSHVYGGDAVTFHTTANIGVRVNLGKTDWTRKATTVAAYDAIVASAKGSAAAAMAAAKAADEANTRLSKENAALKANVADLSREITRLNGALSDANAQKCNFSEYVVYFEIGKTTLTDKEEAHLVAFLDKFLQNNNVKINVNGATDTKTGSAARNTYLRAQRALYIVNFIQEKYGVKAEVVEAGLQDISTPSLSRAAVIAW